MSTDGKSLWTAPVASAGCEIQSYLMAGGNTVFYFHFTVSSWSGSIRAYKPPGSDFSMTGQGESATNGNTLTIELGTVYATDLAVGLNGGPSVAGDAPIASYSWSNNATSVTSSVDVTSNASVSLTVTDTNGVTGTASGTINVSYYCDDPDAQNDDEWGSCTYAPPPCSDPTASNYGQSGTCVYPPPVVCEDPAADNYLQTGDCSYPPPQVCEDPSADNFGSVGTCDYADAGNGGDGGGGGGGSGGGGGGGGITDPCEIIGNEDPACSGGGGNQADSRKPSSIAGRGGISASVLSTPASVGVKSYYVLLVEGWAKPSVLSMVARFRHGSGFVDAIYLPAANPTAMGWALAVRALQHDRNAEHDALATRRVIRVGADGTENFTLPNGMTKAMPAWDPIAPAALSKIASDFSSGLLSKLKHTVKQPTKEMKGVRIVRVTG